MSESIRDTNTGITLQVNNDGSINTSFGNIVLVEYSGNNPIYVGEAKPSSLTTQAKWKIFKISYDVNNNPTSVLFADGNTNFDNIWDNRKDGSITYS